MSDQFMEKREMVNKKPIYYKDYQPPAYLIDEIELYFNLQEEFTIVKSLLRIRQNHLVATSTNTLYLNGEALQLQALRLDGDDLTKEQYQLTDSALIINNVPDYFELEIVTKIFPQKNTALIGLYRFDSVYCTQCEAEGFRRITYYLDHPDVLARFTTTIEADKDKFPFLLSNGNVVDLGELENGRHWVKWVDPFRKPSYLFALVAGDFAILDDTYVTVSGKEVHLRIYVNKDFQDQVRYAMDCLKLAMSWDEKTYGREYDLDIYMIVAIGDFNTGAMENKGLNIFNTKFILAKKETATDDDYIHILSVIGHEYFHNWTGNRVTCRDWFQLSLKEGLTIFRDQGFTEDTFSHAAMRIRDVTYLREIQFPEDAGPLAHSVRPDSYIEINNFYTSTIYNKGAEVLRMLRTILGKPLFRKGMDLYFNQHDGQAVTIEDYIKCMEDVSGIDLTQFKLWYTQAGTPDVKVVDDYDSVNHVYTLTFNQTIPQTPDQKEKQPMLIPIRIGLLNSDGTAIPLTQSSKSREDETVLLLKEASQSFQFQDIPVRPIPSLLRNFSAPVILNFSYSDADLLFLFMHDQDEFNRFEAGQKYMLRVLLNLVRDYQQNNPLSLPQSWIDTFSYLLKADYKDLFLLTEMLALPSEKYIAEQMEVVDVVAIHAVREFAIVTIAQELESLFFSIYQADRLQPHNPVSNSPQITTTEIGKRKLRNCCLFYLMKLAKETDATRANYIELGMKQFNDSLHTNMTNTQAALTYLTNIDVAERDEALHQFYQTYEHDALVVDKWFAIQAASQLPNTLTQIKKLFRHPAFDIKNPNKVYALIGTFGNRNPINFHAENGEGYAFLRDVVQQIDHINPQIAARMVNPLTRFARYDKERQRLMKEQLEIILQDKKISSDLYELVIKSLEH